MALRHPVGTGFWGLVFCLFYLGGCGKFSNSIIYHTNAFPYDTIAWVQYQIVLVLVEYEVRPLQLQPYQVLSTRLDGKYHRPSSLGLGLFDYSQAYEVMDLFHGGHVEHRRKFYIRDLCKKLPVDEIFLTRPQ